MTEVWKSIGRHFCEICKSWMANNKISITHHEASQRHKANLERKIRDAEKKKVERDAEAGVMASAVRAMEEQAMQRMRTENPAAYDAMMQGKTSGYGSVSSGSYFDPSQIGSSAAMASALAKRAAASAPSGPAAKVPMYGVGGGGGGGTMMRKGPPQAQSAVPEQSKEARAMALELQKEKELKSKQQAKWEEKQQKARERIKQREEQAAAMATDAGDILWVESKAPDGEQIYYFHMYNGETTWERPDRFLTTEEYEQRLAALDRLTGGATLPDLAPGDKPPERAEKYRQPEEDKPKQLAPTPPIVREEWDPEEALERERIWRGQQQKEDEDLQAAAVSVLQTQQQQYSQASTSAGYTSASVAYSTASVAAYGGYQFGMPPPPPPPPSQSEEQSVVKQEESEEVTHHSEMVMVQVKQDEEPAEEEEEAEEEQQPTASGHPFGSWKKVKPSTRPPVQVITPMMERFDAEAARRKVQADQIAEEEAARQRGEETILAEDRVVFAEKTASTTGTGKKSKPVAFQQRSSKAGRNTRTRMD